MIPIPNQRELWPNFRSPLFWDMMAITTYLIGSTLFMYLGADPRSGHGPRSHDRLAAQVIRRVVAGLARHRRRMAQARNGRAISSAIVIIPVMFSVHTGVSWDFAMALQPGWHSTIFGPFFIVGALFSGVAAVILVLIIIRKAMRYGYFLREEHFNAMGLFLLILSFTWIYFYFTEWITNWYGNLPHGKSDPEDADRPAGSDVLPDAVLQHHRAGRRRCGRAGFGRRCPPCS